MSKTIGPVGPRMPVFLAGLVVGILLTVAYYRFVATPAAPAPAAEIQLPGAPN
jgi:hypothetical protein